MDYHLGEHLHQSPTWNAHQTFAYGLTVPTGSLVSFPNNSIPYTCILGLRTASTPLGTQTNINLRNTKNLMVGENSVKLPFTIPWVYDFNTYNETITLFSCYNVNTQDVMCVYMVQMDTYFLGGSYTNTNNVYLTISNVDTGTIYFNNTYHINFSYRDQHYSNTFILPCNYSTALRFQASTQLTGVIAKTTYTMIIDGINLTFTRIA